jgi:hypothetical protein
MAYEAINFGKKFALFDEQWQPKVIAEMNDYQFTGKLLVVDARAVTARQLLPDAMDNCGLANPARFQGCSASRPR